ncbi:MULTISPECIES: hypothetical protein [Tsukamurella]|uniref:Uncharacterized protein n=1 Tax=Tsukamurella asaccharolytica TaxID=2592067 RepID=A0A5C5R6J5_9ACTN|nr:MULTISPECIES: hypothetical protein [Tsukamurella]KXP07935.1 hypothetical protein AXK59_01265 [Tsukamurella tyrosinosolvens]TWS18428.1 hypothetical protein FK529_15110 [Tsukamurella asaccharolytica]
MSPDDLPRPGEHWAYRKASHLPASEVEVLGSTQVGRKVRIEIRHLDDGRTESVTIGKLPTRWDQLDALLAHEAKWRWLTDFELHEVEDRVLTAVFERQVPESIASIFDTNDNVTTVYDVPAFEEFLGCTLDELAARAPVDLEADPPIIGREGTLIAAELICRRSPQPILDDIHEEELKARHACKHGAPNRVKLRPDDPDTTSPEWEWYWYLKDIRPRHELLRQWCGFRAVSADERRRAAEEEARRLDLLLTEAIEALKHHNEWEARAFAERQEDGRITPERVRPQIDRPLKPHEIPVREVKVRSRRWW